MFGAYLFNDSNRTYIDGLLTVAITIACKKPPINCWRPVLISGLHCPRLLSHYDRLTVAVRAVAMLPIRRSASACAFTNREAASVSSVLDTVPRLWFRTRQVWRCAPSATNWLPLLHPAPTLFAAASLLMHSPTRLRTATGLCATEGFKWFAAAFQG